MNKLLLIVFAFGLVMAGCDDSSDPEAQPAAGAELTRAEFTAEVDAICADDSSDLEGLEAPDNLKDSGPFLREVLPVIRDQLNRIREVGEPPEPGRETFLRWFAARDGIVETTAAMIEAAEEGDESQFQRMVLVQRELDERADAAADAYGLEVCGGGS